MVKKIEKEKIIKKGKGTLSEFKDFISKGNVLDMAVGVIIGAAFGKIVTSLVDNILMPIIGVLIGGIDFSGLTIQFKDATIGYGIFIQNIIDFLIVAFCIFIFIKILRRKKKEEEVKQPEKDETVVLLEEIRDLLKKKK